MFFILENKSSSYLLFVMRSVYIRCFQVYVVSTLSVKSRLLIYFRLLAYLYLKKVMIALKLGFAHTTDSYASVSITASVYL